MLYLWGTLHFISRNCRIVRIPGLDKLFGIEKRRQPNDDRFPCRQLRKILRVTEPFGRRSLSRRLELIADRWQTQCLVHRRE